MLKKVLTITIAIIGLLAMIPSIVVISKNASEQTNKIIIDTSLTNVGTDAYNNLYDIVDKQYNYFISPNYLDINNNNFNFNRLEYGLNEDEMSIIFNYLDYTAIVEIFNDGTLVLNTYNTPFPNDITLTITYQVPQNNVIATLLSLVPLILIGGLLGYLLLFNNKENE